MRALCIEDQRVSTLPPMGSASTGPDAVRPAGLAQTSAGSRQLLIVHCRGEGSTPSRRSSIPAHHVSRHSRMRALSKTMAVRAVASAAQFQNPSIAVNLPCYWYTLYVLQRLDQATFDKAVQAGKIHPEMTRSEAEALLPAKQVAPSATRDSNSGSGIPASCCQREELFLLIPNAARVCGGFSNTTVS